MAVSTARPPDSGWRRFLPVALLAVLSIVFDVAPADAQGVWGRSPPWVGLPPKPAKKPPSLASRRSGDGQMLVRADEVHYDYTNERVLASGKVQIYYSGSTLEAEKVIYDQKTKRLRAEGQVRLVEADGKIVYAEFLELSDDYRDGFVDSLRLDAADKTRFAARRADRTAGNTTVFQSGVYTACEACKEDPRKPPTWQVKAARIIHNEAEKMIYFEDARLEFFGFPVAYMPYFSAPDPTVKRKSGFLVPEVSVTGKYGVGVATPYYWALAPDYDATITPVITSKQGALLQGEWRQRLVNGAYSVRAAGIFQQDKEAFRNTDGSTLPGYRDFRGIVSSSGRFDLAAKWVWGWDAALLSDRTFLQDYALARRNLLRGENQWLGSGSTDPFRSSGSEAISQVFLAGRGERSYFDLRAVHFYGFSTFDQQSQLPIVHPVMDYSYVFIPPVFGGELGYKMNLTSLTRFQADFDPITQNAVTTNACEPTTADPAVKTRANCLLRGIAGNYTRFSAETTWRRTITDPFGQVFTPFASVRADVASMSIRPDPGVSNYIPTGEDSLIRATPTVGVEYRYPFIALHSWGTQTFEPIAQLIVRPNEAGVRRLPNEDAQSLIFDDSNLFKVDKFSGWDRSEGGSRLNAGVQYTAQFNRAGSLNVLFGQSYQLFGKNSFAFGGPSNTGIESGLETNRSDYVARVAYQPNSTYLLVSRFRFDEQSFDVRRFELEGRTTFDRWAFSVLYGNYDKQPNLGFLERREGVLSTASVKLTQNWSALAGVRYDIGDKHLDQYRVGLGYIDDCFAISVNYITDYKYSGSSTSDHKVFLQINLRTLGGSGVSF